MKCNAMRERMKNEHVYKYTYIYISAIISQFCWNSKSTVRTCLEIINQSAANDSPGPNLKFYSNDSHFEWISLIALTERQKM